MIVLRPTQLHWLDEDVRDLCAHSPIEFRVADRMIVDDPGDCAVGAASVILLRTLFESHKLDKQQPLFPHRAHSMYSSGDDVYFDNACRGGVDAEVARVENDVVLTPVDQPEVRIPFIDWARAVCAFSDEVAAFYQRSAPKQPLLPDDIEIFDLFMSEWHRQRKEAEVLLRNMRP